MDSKVLEALDLFPYSHVDVDGGVLGPPSVLSVVVVVLFYLNGIEGGVKTH